MGGNGTNQQKHRENQKKQYSRGLGDGGDWHKAKKTSRKPKLGKQKKHIPEVSGTEG